MGWGRSKRSQDAANKAAYQWALFALLPGLASTMFIHVFLHFGSDEGRVARFEWAFYLTIAAFAVAFFSALLITWRRFRKLPDAGGDAGSSPVLDTDTKE